MSIVAIGCNHRSTPLSILERMTIAPDDIPKALADLGSADHLSEVVVLSTCNRVEIYAYAEKFHGGYQDIREFFGRHAGLAPEDVNDHLYALHDTEAIRHLFSVTAGLDSAVIGALAGCCTARVTAVSSAKRPDQSGGEVVFAKLVILRIWPLSRSMTAVRFSLGTTAASVGRRSQRRPCF